MFARYSLRGCLQGRREISFLNFFLDTIQEVWFITSNRRSCLELGKHPLRLQWVVPGCLDKRKLLLCIILTYNAVAKQFIHLYVLYDGHFLRLGRLTSHWLEHLGFALCESGTESDLSFNFILSLCTTIIFFNLLDMFDDASAYLRKPRDCIFLA